MPSAEHLGGFLGPLLGDDLVEAGPQPAEASDGAGREPGPVPGPLGLV